MQSATLPKYQTFLSKFLPNLHASALKNKRSPWVGACCVQATRLAQTHRSPGDIDVQLYGLLEMKAYATYLDIKTYLLVGCTESSDQTLEP